MRAIYRRLQHTTFNPYGLIPTRAPGVTRPPHPFRMEFTLDKGHPVIRAVSWSLNPFSPACSRRSR